MKQKFKRGDVVHIAANLEWENMSHFEKDEDVVIMYSYADEYGGSDTKSYSVLFFDGSEVAWYKESQLTFLRHGGKKLISEIIRKSKKKEKLLT